MNLERNLERNLEGNLEGKREGKRIRRRRHMNQNHKIKSTQHTLGTVTWMWMWTTYIFLNRPGWYSSRVQMPMAQMTKGERRGIIRAL